MATVSTNIAKPKKKKKDDAPSTGVTPFKVESKGKTELSVTPGKTTKTYTSSSANTGHPAYGKGSKDGKEHAFVEEARKKKQDIAYDKEGKPYRAGVTVTKETPPKLSIATPRITIGKVAQKESVKPKTSTEEIRQKGGKQPLKKMVRVDYLRNKDAKGGISKERHRPKKEAGY